MTPTKSPDDYRNFVLNALLDARHLYQQKKFDDAEATIAMVAAERVLQSTPLHEAVYLMSVHIGEQKMYDCTIPDSPIKGLMESFLTMIHLRRNEQGLPNNDQHDTIALTRVLNDLKARQV